tara:strand:- start:890 stop:1612 length:723 start_codon:yes stop_codon:yes gene_type:complete
MAKAGTATNQVLTRLPKKTQDANGDGIISPEEMMSFGQDPNPTVTAKQNFTAVKYGNDKGTLRFGHIHKKGDVTAGVMLDTPDGRHQFSLDIDGQRKGWTTSTSPGNFQVLAGEDNEEPQDTLILNAVNGNICITATNGKIRLQGTDIELIAVGEGGAKGHIKCTATETFTIHETKKIIFDSKVMTKITSTGIMNISANTCLRIYGSLIKAVTDACSVKDTAVGGQKYGKENNQVSTSAT